MHHASTNTSSSIRLQTLPKECVLLIGVVRVFERLRPVLGLLPQSLYDSNGMAAVHVKV